VKRKTKRWIQVALAKHKKGALHKQLGIPESETIPLRTLQSAAKASGILGKRARLALNLRKIGRRRK
jgi:hypothetical protein